MQRQVVITIATYKRPESLSELLISLHHQQSGFPHKIVVVDNDAAASAREIVASLAPEAVYLVEPRPSISAARNAGVEEALRFSPWALAFIDDDEIAPETWLDELISCMLRFDADVVTGPVEYVLSGAAADYKYFEKIDRPDGSVVTYVATNNALVRAHWFAPGSRLRFDEKFGLTGGEDLELFLRLQQQGGRCVWAREALVVSKVQPERLEWRWHINRELRNGQLIARIRNEFHGYSRIRLVLEGVRMISTGLLRASREALLGRNSIKVQFQIFAGVGWVRAGMGLYYLEYGRRYVAPPPLAQQHSESDRAL